MWYSITVHAEPGQGDYGSDNKQVWAGNLGAGKAGKELAIDIARRLASSLSIDGTANIWSGRGAIGQLVTEIQL